MAIIKSFLTQSNPGPKNSEQNSIDYNRTGNIEDLPPRERQAKISASLDFAQVGFSLLPDSLQGKKAFYRLGLGVETRPIRYTQVGGVAFRIKGDTNFWNQHILQGGATGEFNVGESGMYRLFAGAMAGIQFDRVADQHSIRPSVQGEFGVTVNLTRLFRVSPFIAAQGILPRSTDSFANRSELNFLMGFRLGFHFLLTGEPSVS